MGLRLGLAACAAALVAAFCFSADAWAQAVTQSGPSAPGHAPMYLLGPGQGFASVMDSGFASGLSVSGTPTGTGLSESLQFNGLGNQGTGPFGTHNCMMANPSSATVKGVNSPSGFYFLCLDADIGSNGALVFGSAGGAPEIPLQCIINGVSGNCFNSTPPPPVNTLPVFDPRTYGAVCNTSQDSTSGIQEAVDAAELQGGWVIIPCPMTVAGQINVSTGSIQITGLGPVGYPGQQDIPGPSVWPPTSGPALNCTSTTATGCIVINGALGVEIDHINFGNPQPTPPPTGTSWTPTLYPFVIATVENSGWQNLTIHNVSCTSCSKFIDLEGVESYSDAYTGTQIVLRDLWCNACLNEGIRLHLIDNPFLLSHFETTPQWNFNRAALGSYTRQNFVCLDVQYAAAPQFDNIDCFAPKVSLQLTNGTVTNNFGSLTFAMSAGQFTNFMSNQACQGITMPGGNGTLTPGQVAFSNSYWWGDQSGFNCSAGIPMMQLDSNLANFSFSQIGVFQVDTFAIIGCGTPGVGSCPASTPTGGASLRINDMDVFQYSAFSAGQPFIKIPSNAFITFGNTNLAAIRPSGSAGPLMAPGLDNTQGYSGIFAIGGGANDIEGAAALIGSQGMPGGGINGSGFVNYYTPDHTNAGYTGGCTDTGSNQGCSVASTVGSIFLKPQFQTSGATTIAFGTNPSSGLSIINFGSLPTSCTGQATGTLWDNAHVLSVC